MSWKQVAEQRSALIRDLYKQIHDLRRALREVEVYSEHGVDITQKVLELAELADKGVRIMSQDLRGVE